MFSKKQAEPPPVEEEQLPTLGTDREYHRLKRERDAARKRRQEAAEAYEAAVAERREKEEVLNYVGLTGLKKRIDETEQALLEAEDALREADNRLGSYELERKPEVRGAYHEVAERILGAAFLHAKRSQELREDYEELLRHASRELGEQHPLPLLFPQISSDLATLARELASTWGFHSFETAEVREQLEREEAERLSSVASSEWTRDVLRINSDPELLRQQLARENRRRFGG